MFIKLLVSAAVLFAAIGSFAVEQGKAINLTRGQRDSCYRAAFVSKEITSESEEYAIFNEPVWQHFDYLDKSFWGYDLTYINFRPKDESFIRMVCNGSIELDSSLDGEGNRQVNVRLYDCGYTERHWSNDYVRTGEKSEFSFTGTVPLYSDNYCRKDGLKLK